MHDWHIYKDFSETSKEAATFIAAKISQCIANNGICHVALPGGNTPVQCLHYLLEKKLPWDKIHWYPGDERCYPSGHADRNDVMLQDHFWSLMSEPNVHPIPAELGAAAAAQVYAKTISAIKKIDIAFLGLGEDGHTASLFPGNEALNDQRPVVAVFNSPKEPSERVSLSISTLSHAACRIVLAGGAKKAKVISRIKDSAPLPVNRIGDIHWFVDEESVL
ncbi:MAG: 6-phosphogluconolactonase [Gammaproteobacteria bacterium]|nr:6-phosphogluconolactonase [Gammaproteobacteria bacterium]